MTPAPRLVRRVAAFSLVLALAVSGFALAQAPEPIERTLTLGVIEADCEGIATGAPCWDASVLVAQPGDTVTLRADLRWSQNPHNIHVTQGVPEAPKTDLAPAALHEVTFTMPASGEVTFVCDAHPTMTARVLAPAAAAAAGGGADHGVPGLGVNFLAYWVGIIAFALLFIVYGLTFFLFKYNETPATTDQWDRSDAPAGRRFGAGAASLLALVFSAVVIGAVIYLARSA